MYTYAVVTPLRKVATYEPRIKEKIHELWKSKRINVGMLWSHLCVKSPRMSHVLKTNYGNQNKLRDIEDAQVNSF